MKKSPRKLRLNRDTLVHLDPQAAAVALGGTEQGVVTSCTYPCACPTGCTDDQPCLGGVALA
jgi:hypothetical protein